MSVTQTVDIPDSRRLTIDVPHDVPAGKTILTFTPLPATPNRKPISQYLGIISPDTYGDGVVYQRKLRDEWDD